MVTRPPRPPFEDAMFSAERELSLLGCAVRTLRAIDGGCWMQTDDFRAASIDVLATVSPETGKLPDGSRVIQFGIKSARLLRYVLEKHPHLDPRNTRSPHVIMGETQTI